jgi:hypothetical protein
LDKIYLESGIDPISSDYFERVVSASGKHIRTVPGSSIPDNVSSLLMGLLGIGSGGKGDGNEKPGKKMGGEDARGDGKTGE